MFAFSAALPLQRTGTVTQAQRMKAEKALGVWVFIVTSKLFAKVFPRNEGPNQRRVVRGSFTHSLCLGRAQCPSSLNFLVAGTAARSSGAQGAALGDPRAVFSAGAPSSGLKIKEARV